MIVQTYAYKVDAGGKILTRMAGDSWQFTGVVTLGDVQLPTYGLGSIGSAERDLLRVAAVVLDVDRLSRRHAGGANTLIRDVSWQRGIQIRIAVENPERWSRAAPVLSELLTFMTDDTWDLAFEGARAVPSQQVLFPSLSNPPREVALFSGGLDSVAGAYLRGVRAPGHLLAVSACGNEVRGCAQHSAVERLRELGIAIEWLKLVHQLKDPNRARREFESSQRSRGLLFLAMGAVVASSLGVPTFSVHETGIGCLNLPLSPAQVASQGTRAMHPRTLATTNVLFREVLPAPVRVIVPFFFHTKGQLCQEVGSVLPRLAEVSSSCDEGEGHKKNPMQHCGLCTSCVFRRIALFAACAERDKTQYLDTRTRRHGEFELNAFAYHAAELAACASFEDLIAIDPNVRYAALAPMESEFAMEEVRARILGLYGDYSREISSFLLAAKPRLRTCQRLVKEHERDLFAAIG